MKPLADLRAAVRSASFLAVAPAPCWGRVAHYLWKASDALGLRALESRCRPLDRFTAAEAARARKACARLAHILRHIAADLAEAAQRDCLLALAEDLDPL